MEMIQVWQYCFIMEVSEGNLTHVLVYILKSYLQTLSTGT